MTTRTINGKRYQLYDAFPSKTTAKHYANDLRKQGQRVCVIKVSNTQRLKWGLFVNGSYVR